MAQNSKQTNQQCGKWAQNIAKHSNIYKQYYIYRIYVCICVCVCYKYLQITKYTHTHTLAWLQK